MLSIGHAADHRPAHRRRNCDQIALRDQPGDHPVRVAVEDAGDVGGGLPLAEADFVAEEGYGMAAEPVDGHLEGDSGSIAGSLEDERQVSSAQWCAQVLTLLGPPGELEDGVDLISTEVGDAEQVAAGEGVRHRPSQYMSAWTMRLNSARRDARAACAR